MDLVSLSLLEMISLFSIPMLIRLANSLSMQLQRVKHARSSGCDGLGNSSFRKSNDSSMESKSIKETTPQVPTNTIIFAAEKNGVVLSIKSLCMFIVANCADSSLVLRDWTKDNFCLFDEVAVAGACSGHTVEGEGHSEGILESLCES